MYDFIQLGTAALGWSGRVLRAVLADGQPEHSKFCESRRKCLTKSKGKYKNNLQLEESSLKMSSHYSRCGASSPARFSVQVVSLTGE